MLSLSIVDQNHFLPYAYEVVSRPDCKDKNETGMFLYKHKQGCTFKFEFHSAMNTILLTT